MVVLRIFQYYGWWQKFSRASTSTCNFLIANLPSKYITSALKEISFEWSWQLLVFSVTCVCCWSTGLTEKNLFMKLNASAEIYANGRLEIKSSYMFSSYKHKSSGPITLNVILPGTFLLGIFLHCFVTFSTLITTISSRCLSFASLILRFFKHSPSRFCPFSTLQISP